MIYSMTGYAVGVVQARAGAIHLELRAVNHRYLDLTIRLPDELRALETGLREQLAAALKRGKVECRMSLVRSAPDPQALVINEPLVRQLGSLGILVQAQVPACTPLSVSDILHWPGVVVETTASFDELAATVHQLAKTVVEELSASRRREGAKLKAMIEQCCAQMEALIVSVGPQIPALQSLYQEKLALKLREAGLSADDERLRQEFALFAAKIDVAEELSRLQTHVGEVRRVLEVGSDRGGSAGKRLDFLMQELNREANTLGSKSPDATLSKTALELKVLIEQMREQVQNIE